MRCHSSSRRLPGSSSSNNITMKSLLMLTFFAVVAEITARRLEHSHHLVKRDSTPFNYELPSNASTVVGTITTGFDCSDLNYGYYADMANNCQIYHVCYPYMDPQGIIYTRMFSFLCGAGSIFDQSTLTCNFPEYALPCEAAADFYAINEYLVRDDREFRDGLNDIFKR